jgi:hypothetical protein
MYRIFNAAWKQCRIPKDWGKATICLIDKRKEDKADFKLKIATTSIAFGCSTSVVITVELIAICYALEFVNSFSPSSVLWAR